MTATRIRAYPWHHHLKGKKPKPWTWRLKAPGFLHEKGYRGGLPPQVHSATRKPPAFVCHSVRPFRDLFEVLAVGTYDACGVWSSSYGKLRIFDKLCHRQSSGHVTLINRKSADVILYRGIASEDNSGKIVISTGYRSRGIAPVTRLGDAPS